MISVRNLKGSLLSWLQILLGTLLTAAAFGLVVVPKGFAAGGVTGFATLLQPLIPVPLSVLILVINAVLFLMGLLFLGLSFAMKTMCVSLGFPLALNFFLRWNDLIPNQGLIPILTAGLLLGVGAGLLIRCNSSGGGFDVLAVILNRKFRIPVALVINLCDTAIILTQAIGQPVSKTLSGIAVILISTLCINFLVVRHAQVPGPRMVPNPAS